MINDDTLPVGEYYNNVKDNIKLALEKSQIVMAFDINGNPLYGKASDSERNARVYSTIDDLVTYIITLQAICDTQEQYLRSYDSKFPDNCPDFHTKVTDNIFEELKSSGYKTEYDMEEELSMMTKKEDSKSYLKLIKGNHPSTI